MVIVRTTAFQHLYKIKEFRKAVFPNLIKGFLLLGTEFTEVCQLIFPTIHTRHLADVPATTKPYPRYPRQHSLIRSSFPHDATVDGPTAIADHKKRVRPVGRTCRGGLPPYTGPAGLTRSAVVAILQTGSCSSCE